MKFRLRATDKSSRETDKACGGISPSPAPTKGEGSSSKLPRGSHTVERFGAIGKPKKVLAQGKHATKANTVGDTMAVSLVTDLNGAAGSPSPSSQRGYWRETLRRRLKNSIEMINGGDHVAMAEKPHRVCPTKNPNLTGKN
jgi:hypothetical protein